MSQLEIGFVRETTIQFNNSSCSKEEFLNLTIENVLLKFHSTKANFSYFYLNNGEEPLCFVVSQHADLTSELKMLKTKNFNHPSKTQDLFGNQDQLLSSVTLKTLLNDVENDKADFHLAIDNIEYVFRLALKNQADKVVSTVNEYIEDMDNMKDYKEDNKSKIKLH